MSKRKSLSEVVQEQALELDALRKQVVEQAADFRVLESAHETQSAALEQITAKFKEACETVELTRGVNEKLTKELESSKSSYGYMSKRNETAEAEIEQAHAAMDAIPEAISREFEKEYGKGTRSLTARLMGTMLAVARAGK